MNFAPKAGMDTITMTCPTCGVILEVRADQSDVCCWYCRTNYHLGEKTMEATLTGMHIYQVEGELTSLVATKEHKLDELARVVNAIIHQPVWTLQHLLSKRNRLEDDILELSLVIHLKQMELSRVKQVRGMGQTGD